MTSHCDHEHHFSTNREDLIRALGEVLPTDSLMYEEEDLRPYECDSLSAYRQLPMVVAIRSM